MTERTCSSEGCKRPHSARGYCSAHWKQWRNRNADVVAADKKEREAKRPSVCTVEGCDNASKARGYCGTHYSRWRQKGDPGDAYIKSPEPDRACSVDGCDRPHCARGYCSAHWQRWSDGKDLAADVRVVGHSTDRDKHGNKRCTQCETWKPESEFSRASTALDGLHSWCKRCVSYSSVPRKYRITVDQYSRTLETQGAACAICRKQDAAGRRLHVDHDHKCCPGQRSCGRCVRALLCGKCNVGLGAFDDDVSVLLGAIEYLKRWNTEALSDVRPIIPTDANT